MTKRKATSISLSPEEHRGLQVLAKDHHQSVTGFVRAIATGIYSVGVTPNDRAVVEIQREIDRIWQAIEGIQETLTTQEQRRS